MFISCIISLLKKTNTLINQKISYLDNSKIINEPYEYELKVIRVYSFNF